MSEHVEVVELLCTGIRSTLVSAGGEPSGHSATSTHDLDQGMEITGNYTNINIIIDG
jgi:hypothetical protein